MMNDSKKPFGFLGRKNSFLICSAAAVLFSAATLAYGITLHDGSLIVQILGFAFAAFLLLGMLAAYESGRETLSCNLLTAFLAACVFIQFAAEGFNISHGIQLLESGSYALMGADICQILLIILSLSVFACHIISGGDGVCNKPRCFNNASLAFASVLIQLIEAVFLAIAMIGGGISFNLWIFLAMLSYVFMLSSAVCAEKLFN